MCLNDQHLEDREVVQWEAACPTSAQTGSVPRATDSSLSMESRVIPEYSIRSKPLASSSVTQTSPLNKQTSN